MGNDGDRPVQDPSRLPNPTPWNLENQGHAIFVEHMSFAWEHDVDIQKVIQYISIGLLSAFGREGASLNIS